MKKLFILNVLIMGLFALTACNRDDGFFEKASLVNPSPNSPVPSVDPIPPVNSQPEVPVSLTKGVCKIETALNYEPRDSDGDMIFIPDNSLCEKAVCIKEYVETPFELVNPEIVKFGCETSVSNQDYEVTLGWAADDASTVYMNGIELGRTTDWRVFHEEKIILKGGCHTLAIHAIDVYKIISGILAYLKVDGKVVWRSGDGNQFLKAYGPQTPVGDWTSLNYDESEWKSSEICSDISPWGSSFQNIRDDGSKWIWWSANCKNLTQAYFRLSFSLMPPTQILINREELCKVP